jgi:TatA/E family protein of Tat protein translocase
MQEMIFIFVLALLIFGPKKLPELGKTLGKAMTEFRRASNDLKSTFDREMNNLERETASTTKEISSGFNYDTYNYETGKYSQITFGWSESTQQLTIGARSGSYTGMPKTRTFNVVWVGANHGSGVEPTATADKVVAYDGSVVTVAAQ